MNRAMQIRHDALRDAARCVIQDKETAYGRIVGMAVACEKPGAPLSRPLSFGPSPPCPYLEGMRVQLTEEAMEWRFVERLGLPSRAGLVVSASSHAWNVAVLFDGDELPGVRLVAVEWLELDA